jgi:hypothetical protein
VLLGDMSSWLEDEGLAPAVLAAGQMARFLRARRERGHRELFTAAGAAPLLKYLTGLGFVPVHSQPVLAGPDGVLLDDLIAGQIGETRHTITHPRERDQNSGGYQNSPCPTSLRPAPPAGQFPCCACTRPPTATPAMPTPRCRAGWPPSTATWPPTTTAPARSPPT